MIQTRNLLERKGIADEPLLSGHPPGNGRWPLNGGLITLNNFNIRVIS